MSRLEIPGPDKGQLVVEELGGIPEASSVGLRRKNC